MTPAVLVLSGPVARDEVPGLCDDVRELLGAGGAGPGSRVVVCDVGGLGPPGLAAVDLLARLELTARRAGAHRCLRREKRRGGRRLRRPGPGPARRRRPRRR
ncbi:STAS domain-containing protein, partial [Streptomyces sp. NPDC002172]